MAIPRKYKIGVLCTAPSAQMSAQYEALRGLGEFHFVMLFMYGQEHNPAWGCKLPEGMESVILPVPWYLPRRFRGRCNAKVSQVLDAHNCDALILHGYYDRLALWQAIHWCRRHGRPYLVRTDANIDKEKSPLRRWWRKAAFGRNLTDAAAMLVIGEKNRQYYELFGGRPSQFFLAPWEVDYEPLETTLAAAAPQREATRERMGLRANEVVFVCVSRLLKLKGIGTVIEAVGRAAQKGLPVRLLIVGEGPHRTALERQISQTNAPATLCGNLSRGDVALALTASDVFVLASTCEAWALVVNEACLAGLPLLLSDQVGAAADLLIPGENGFVFPAGDVAALAGRMAEMVCDEPRRLRMARRSSEILSKWRREYPAAEGYRQALLYALGQGPAATKK